MTDTAPISGLGPHGERAAAPGRVALSDADLAAAAEAAPRIGLILHTDEGDWSRQFRAGAEAGLCRAGLSLFDIAVCDFDVGAQRDALQRLVADGADGLLTLPITNTEIAGDIRRASDALRAHVLIDNVPTGLVPGRDYRALVSADNFGLGLISAGLLADEIPQGGHVGILGYEVDFFAVNQREIAFRRWFYSRRPDVTLHVRRFTSVDDAAAAAGVLLDEMPHLDGIFAVWDEPAATALPVLSDRSFAGAMVTIDLGSAVARRLAVGDVVTGVAAQQPHALGIVAADAILLSLLGKAVPNWIALPGIPVSSENLDRIYRQIWDSELSA